MKLVWLTDIHLDFLEYDSRMNFYQEIIAAGADKILISGDIANAKSVSRILKEMAAVIQKPIYFVLGNHDYYGGSVASVREEMDSLTRNEPLLHYLPAPMLDVHRLDRQTILLGADCWADGRYGNYQDSNVILNDSRVIKELWQSIKPLRLSDSHDKYKLLNKMQELADEDAYQLRIRLHEAVKLYNPNEVIIAVHVPPFKESSFYRGKMSGDSFLPFYASKITGDVLLEIAETYKDVKFLVFCGHTHGKMSYQPLYNLIVKTGGAEYRYPEIQEVINYEELPFSELIDSAIYRKYSLNDNTDKIAE